MAERGTATTIKGQLGHDVIFNRDKTPPRKQEVGQRVDVFNQLMSSDELTDMNFPAVCLPTTL